MQNAVAYNQKMPVYLSWIATKIINNRISNQITPSSPGNIPPRVITDSANESSANAQEITVLTFIA